MPAKTMSRPPVNAAVVSKGKLMLPGATKPKSKGKVAPVVPRAKVKVRPVAEPEVVVKEKVIGDFGQPLASTGTKSCMQCSKFSTCGDPDKSWDYLCTRYSQRLLVARDIDADVTDIPDRQRYRQGDILSHPSKLLKPATEWTPAQARSKERSLEKMMSRILESSGVVAQDARIDDRDLPTAPNFFTWITDPNFAGNLVKPWAKQIEHPTKLFNEWCPHCTDKKWFNAVPVDAHPEDFLEHVVFLEHGVCPVCHTPKSEMVNDGALRAYNELVGLAGQRSSKTMSVMMQITYDLHRVLKSQNPQGMLGIAGSQILTGTFTALTFAQAKSNMWDPLFNMLSEATWFQNYHEMLDQTGKRIGQELYALKDTYLRYRHRNLLYAPTSPNMRTARGFTRMTAAIDEIGLMHNELAKNGKTRERMNAAEIYASLGNSLVTVREAALEALMSGHDNVTMGYFYNISSPFSRKDMIMTLYEQSRGSDTIYGYRAATWEMNPKIKRDSRLMIARFQQDAIAAMRDFGAVPPISGAPFIRMSSLANTFHKKIGNDATLESRTFINRSGGTQTTGRLRFHREYSGGPCGVFIDAGYNNNCFSGDTRVLTRNGYVPIRTLNGKHEIVTSGGKWAVGDFKAYGRAPLWEIVLKRNKERKVIRATANHRWFAHNRNTHGDAPFREYTTDQLCKGYRLESAYPTINEFKLDRAAVVHGIVFGDGTWGGKNKQHSTANLIHEKADDLVHFFEHYRDRGKYWSEWHDGKGNRIQVRNLPQGLNDTLPEKSAPLNTLLSFLAGYVATDGCVDTQGRVMLNSKTRANIEFAHYICQQAGVPVSEVTTRVYTNNYTKQPTEDHKIFLRADYLPQEFWLRAKHKTRLAAMAGRKVKRPDMWIVESVTATDQREMTYCANVPKTHSFVIEGNILTGNSFAVAVVEKCGEKGNKARVRFAGEVLLTPEAPAHYPSIMRNVVQPLIQHYGASVLAADRWNSIQLLQQMEEEEGAAPLQHSLKYPEFERFRQEGIYDQKLRLPALEVKPKEAMRLALQPGYPGVFNGKPIAHLIYQLVGVQDVPGTTVMKPDAGTDDIFRAIVLGWHVATDPLLADYFASSAGTRATRAIGVVTKGRDMASGSVSNTMGVKRSFGGGGSSGNSMGAVRSSAA